MFDPRLAYPARVCTLFKLHKHLCDEFACCFWHRVLFVIDLEMNGLKKILSLPDLGDILWRKHWWFIYCGCHESSGEDSY